MIAEILSTGEEILTGAVTDTNSAYIAGILRDAGLTVARHSCVGDNAETLTEILKEIAGRADIALVTGGLGPTEDDITAFAAAKASGVELHLDTTAENHIKKFLKRLNKDLTVLNAKQALMPKNSILIDNPAGTALGFILKINKTTFFFLPGVPFEMKKMMPEVIRYIEKNISTSETFKKTSNIKTFGMPEASINEALQDFSQKFENIRLGFRAVFPEIHIKLYGSGNNKKNLEDELKQGENFIKTKIGGAIFSTDGRSMEETVGNILLQKKATLAVAESCTGGSIANRLTDVSGSSEYFLFSGVTYSNTSKIKVLGVLPETLKKYGAVSVETVKEMTVGAKRISGADYAIATSGIAGPTGGTDEKPIGTLCLGIATPETVICKKYIFPFKERLMNKKIFAAMALDRLRRSIIL